MTTGITRPDATTITGGSNPPGHREPDGRRAGRRRTLAVLSLVVLISCSNGADESARQAVTATTDRTTGGVDMDGAPLSKGVADAATADTTSPSTPPTTPPTTFSAPATTVVVPPTFESAADVEPVTADPQPATPRRNPLRPASPTLPVARTDQMLTGVETADGSPRPPSTTTPTSAAPTTAPPTPVPVVTTPTTAPAPSVGPWTQVSCRPLSGIGSC